MAVVVIRVRDAGATQGVGDGESGGRSRVPRACSHLSFHWCMYLRREWKNLISFQENETVKARVDLLLKKLRNVTQTRDEKEVKWMETHNVRALIDSRDTKSSTCIIINSSVIQFLHYKLAGKGSRSTPEFTAKGIWFGMRTLIVSATV